MKISTPSIKFSRYSFTSNYKKQKKAIPYGTISEIFKYSQLFNYSSAPKSVIKQKIIKERTGQLSPIQSEEEYNKILDEIFNYKIQNEAFTANLVINSGYEQAPKELQGLVSYCGGADLSDIINSWLTSRSCLFNCIISDEQMVNIIRAFDYSLNKLDEKYGKHKGKVYRVGYFNPITDKQYYSTSKSLGCAVEHAQCNQPCAQFPYSIIKLKNGHDIHKFQKSIDSPVAKEFAQLEKEVLIDRNSRF